MARVSDEELHQLAAELGEKLCARGWMLATAESCTGGWVGQLITSLPGSSQWYERGFITYANAAKIEMLGVPAETIDEHGAVSEKPRRHGRGALRNSHAQATLAISGIAGPRRRHPAKTRRPGVLRLGTGRWHGHVVHLPPRRRPRGNPLTRGGRGAARADRTDRIDDPL